MIQDSVNQLLGTLAIGSRLASTSINEMRDIKMSNLAAQQEENLANLQKENVDDSMLIEGEPEKRLGAVEATRAKMEKLGNKRLWPNSALQKTANEYGQKANIAEKNFRAISNYTNTGYQARLKAIQRAEEGVYLNYDIANNNNITNFDKKIPMPTEAEIERIKGGK